MSGLFVYSSINRLLILGQSLEERRQNLIMKLTPPKQWVFWAALVLAVVALLGALGVLAVVAGTTSTWLAIAGWALLAAGNAVKGF